MWMGGAMIVGAVVIVLATGNLSTFMPVVGCILMMVVGVRLHSCSLVGSVSMRAGRCSSGVHADGCGQSRIFSYGRGV